MKRKLHIKRFALLAAVMIVLAISFTGCGKDGSNSDSKGSNGPKASLKNFETTTLDGEKFTQDNLKDYDLTVVNVWSTTCGYCIDEMPALEKLKNQLPSNVQFVSICLDGEASPDTAKDSFHAGIDSKDACSKRLFERRTPSVRKWHSYHRVL